VEVLDLLADQLGAPMVGVYVIDDGGDVIIAGPFASDAEALRWIEWSVPNRMAHIRLKGS
jgi:hypothetical protein